VDGWIWSWARTWTVTTLNSIYKATLLMSGEARSLSIIRRCNDLNKFLLYSSKSVRFLAYDVVRSLSMWTSNEPFPTSLPPHLSPQRRSISRTRGCHRSTYLLMGLEGTRRRSYRIPTSVSKFTSPKPIHKKPIHKT